MLQLNPKLIQDFSSDVNKTVIKKYNKVHNRKIGYTFDDAVDYTHHKMARDLDAFEAEKINEEAIKERKVQMFIRSLLLMNIKLENLIDNKILKELCLIQQTR